MTVQMLLIDTCIVYYTVSIKVRPVQMLFIQTCIVCYTVSIKARPFYYQCGRAFRHFVCVILKVEESQLNYCAYYVHIHIIIIKSLFLLLYVLKCPLQRWLKCKIANLAWAKIPFLHLYSSSFFQVLTANKVAKKEMDKV